MFRHLKLSLAICLTTTILSACGGGSKSSSGEDTIISNPSTPPSTPTPPDNSGNNAWQLNVFDDAETFKDLCASPRSGTDPFTNQVFPDKSGSSMDEKMWLRSWSNDTYLWYDEINDVDPTNFSVSNYFNQLKTSQRTSSGAAKDNFHFSQLTANYNQEAFGGTTSGYGINWAFIRNSAPRKLVIAYVENGSPASNAGLSRGLELTMIDGIDFINTNVRADIDRINEALFPSNNNQKHQFTFANQQNNEVSVELSSQTINENYVQNVQILNSTTGSIGYLQFNAFNRNAQNELVNAFSQFSSENISELIIDLRYNGGGLLAMASQLAYMVAGDSQTNNMIFETSRFNDKHPNTDPVTGRTLAPTPFYDKQINWERGGVLTNIQLPATDLTRVFVLTTDSTCSASEALINGLRGINVEVIQIGNTTCGKPYGFYPQDNCGTTYFTIQFQGVNEKGFGDYADGFRPTNNPQFDDQLLGCDIDDDFSQPLGNTNEALLSAAITYAETGSCPVQTQSSRSIQYVKNNNEDGIAIRSKNSILESIINENKIYVPIKQPK